ncbi:jasmonic acid carboxyl methyltransferase [Artemisia annua]|uniref:Jasmonic acid carboxyl methyltransferase n=1 Tax=Artemisia annua TaxID=35608 RepID=A0A2U1NIT6_ARTAN|nr:jasmonic acid carboxyl methyltransferase [Artemisia annua]
MGVADLGCSSGPNSLTVISKIIHLAVTASRQMGRPVPELRVSLNDLPGNDFNDVFESLPGLYKKVKNDNGIESCYVSGVPGSFYGRLFPDKSLHFVHSSSSLHWLSQGLVKKEMIDSFNAPYYAPSPEEVKFLVEKEGSFLVDGVEAFEIEWDGGDSGVLEDSSGKRVAKTIRAVVEPMLAIHFDLNPVMMDELFRRYAKIIDDCFSETRFKYTNLVISFLKKS